MPRASLRAVRMKEALMGERDGRVVPRTVELPLACLVEAGIAPGA